MKIEVGCEYIRRDGSRVRITNNDGHPIYPFDCDDGRCYTEDGKEWADGTISPHDIIQAIATPKSESQQRKATPLWSGVMRYFPDALCAIARLSKAGNDKHNPGQPLHWAREKSTDHEDCVARHLLTPELLDDETGELHAVADAWRALAVCQLLEEKRLGEKAISVQIAMAKAGA